jgi:lysophospholipase L1-like esterase
MKILTLAAILLSIPAARGQQEALLSYDDSLRLGERAVQLMDSTKVSIPELLRAGAPVTENARQALAALRESWPQHSGLTYALLTNVRAYLMLADSVPKPYPFPAEAGKQFSELRDAANRLESHFRALLESKESQIRSPDRDNLRRYAEANLKLGPPQPGNPRVVFLGDSITDGWRLNEYFSDRDFVNRGIGGQVTGEMLGRLKADVVDLKPAALLVLAGTNDIARGTPLETIQNNLTMIADLAEAHKIKPLFASLLPVSDYHRQQTKRRPPETIRALNDWIRRFCALRNLVYVDYYSQLVDASGFLKADYADDGLHPNPGGYRMMAPVALEAIEKAVKPEAPKKKRRWPF